jgi:hypothetical protein
LYFLTDDFIKIFDHFIFNLVVPHFDTESHRRLIRHLVVNTNDISVANGQW